jgi:hypothetical protein
VVGVPKVSVIQSSEAAAQDAASQLTGISLRGVTGKKATVSANDVQCMKDGATVCNQLVGAVAALCAAVLLNVEKVPKIAQVIKQRDAAASKSFGFEPFQDRVVRR